MTQHINIECPSCSPGEEVSHELVKFGKSPIVHCLECGLVYVASGIKIPNKISVRVFVNRIEHPFTQWVKLDAGELLYEDEEIVLDTLKTSEENPFIITSLQAGVRRVPSAFAEELDTIWVRPLEEITFGKKRKMRQKHPVSPENMKPAIEVSASSKGFKIVQET
ncbi:HVO_0476 family zinc finger protein [Methanosarcina sp. DH2]|uniref:HVO_0476 family zinc finger protein n=1 Tax=Methanosarcina sp. DH2 TaxID=2605639 RepID=UPI001E2871B9|nr:HVO_0476 family zinc finger protein [Methanosarcina sp. DH2]